jgi:elongation factor G
MGKYTTKNIRNVAFIGHGNAGKTVLTEALLKEAGIVNRVPAGVMDYSDDEKTRGHSIDSGIAHFSWQDHELNIIDVPGYQEFYHNIISCLSAVETAIVFVTATDGITVNTKRVWNIANQNKLAKIIVVTKLDGENVSFEKTVDQIQENFGTHCIPLMIPNTSGPQFEKIQNILKQDHSSHKEKLVEVTVETNDDLLSQYLDGKTMTPDVIEKQLKYAVMQGKVVPIIPIHPLKEIGIKELLDLILNFTPSPLDVPKKIGKSTNDQELSFEPKEEEPFSAKIFKIFNDSFGRIVYLRVYSGTLKSGTSIYNSNQGKSERIGNLNQIVGKELKTIDIAIPGDIVAITRVLLPKISETLSTEKNSIIYPQDTYPIPMVSLAVQPKSHKDEQKIFTSLQKINEEDTTFIAKRDEDTHELIISCMSDLHLDIMMNRLKNRFQVECSTSTPKIAYRETIVGRADSRYRHKKATGGHGEFGEVAIKLEPNERGKGFEFINQIVGGVIPSQFVASTQKGIEGSMNRGVIAGFPVVDIKISLYDGKTHEVDSSDASFQLAGSMAFQKGFQDAKPVLLEPIYNIDITVPSKFMGDIMGHLNSKRGRIAGSDSDGNYQIIKALIPLVEISNYSTELKSMTGGEGTYSITFSHYDVVPAYLQEKIIAKAKEDKK